MNILVFTNLFPNKNEPNHGIFVKNRIIQYHSYNHSITVFVPVAYTPLLQKYKNSFYFKGLIHLDMTDNVRIIYFKYFHVPKIGMLIQPFSIFLYGYFAIKKHLKEIHFDVIDAHYLYPDGVAAAWLSKVFKLPLIQSARGSDINVFFNYRIPRSLILNALKISDKIITVSDELKNKLTRHGIDADKIHTIPNGIDHYKFYPDPKLYNKRLKRKQNVKRLLMVGHLKKQKGQDLLVKALRSLDERNLPYRIVAYFIGHGPLESTIVKESEIKNCRNRMIYAGVVPNDELVKWYNRVDVLCLLSESEGSPNVILEALACGLPVLATDVGDLKTIINEKIGVITPNRDVDTIVNALNEMLNQTWDRQFIANYSRQFDWTQVSKKTVTVLESAINHNIES